VNGVELEERHPGHRCAHVVAPGRACRGYEKPLGGEVEGSGLGGREAEAGGHGGARG
jgi:hypothetical protein